MIFFPQPALHWAKSLRHVVITKIVVSSRSKQFFFRARMIFRPPQPIFSKFFITVIEFPSIMPANSFWTQKPYMVKNANFWGKTMLIDSKDNLVSHVACVHCVHGLNLIDFPTFCHQPRHFYYPYHYFAHLWVVPTDRSSAYVSKANLILRGIPISGTRCPQSPNTPETEQFMYLTFQISSRRY